ncbi:hypothetical protein N665_1773s0003 [Sinapis alba]|nr:hypothetical protein N665_1773s0003 [Sinapis alba]
MQTHVEFRSTSYLGVSDFPPSSLLHHSMKIKHHRLKIFGKHISSNIAIFLKIITILSSASVVFIYKPKLAYIHKQPLIQLQLGCSSSFSIFSSLNSFKSIISNVNFRCYQASGCISTRKMTRALGCISTRKMKRASWIWPSNLMNRFDLDRRFLWTRDMNQ